MKFLIPTNNQQVVSLTRRISYTPQKATDRNEVAFTRTLMGGEFPRFHLYIKAEGDNFVFNLHLDQKQSKYAGSAAHGGEYDGRLVEDEAHRIQELLNKPIQTQVSAKINKPGGAEKENSGTLSAIFRKMFGN